jgi:hypothetical protein
VKSYDPLTDNMQVPRWLPDEKRWVVEVYDCFGALRETKRPNAIQAKWLLENPVMGLDCNAEFHITYNRKLAEILTVHREMKRKERESKK